MATNTPFTNSPFSKPADKPASTQGDKQADSSTSFLKPGQTSAFGQTQSPFATNQQKPFGATQPTSPFAAPKPNFGAQKPASSPFSSNSPFNTGASAFNSGAASSFSAAKPTTGTNAKISPFGSPQSPLFNQKTPTFGSGAPQTSTFQRPTQKPASVFNKPATSQFNAAAKPFVSLRQQSQPRAASPSSLFTPQTPQSATGLRQNAPSLFSQTQVSSPYSQPSPAAYLSDIPQAPHATSPFRKDLHITNEEFILLRDFIYQLCGIYIAENRKYLVENRLSNRIKELNLKSYTEYYNYLRFDTNRKQELTKLYEVVTTNETSFFRNPPQLEVFQRIVLGEIFDKLRKTGQKKLRIWSAGCSTGEEPYTLSIILHETLKSEIGLWDIKITANDLSEAVLLAARRGTYSEYALRTTPKEIIDKYFQKEGSIYKLDPAIKRIVSFGQINLNDREQLRRVERSQIVFCRNVIIYFDDDMKRRVINSFYDNLLPDGILIIGHSESLHGISRAFKLDHHKGTILYRKTS